MDVVVTIPAAQHEHWERFRKVFLDWIRSGHDGYYFWQFHGKPKSLGVGDRIYYTHCGFVVGFNIVADLAEETEGITSWPDGHHFPPGWYATMLVDTWRWIEPITMRGFQGFRYFRRDRRDVVIIGSWLDPMPEIE